MPHEMTRTTAAERAELVRVGPCDVALDLTRGDEQFRSTSVIRFSCARPGAASYADLRADRVHEIILNGRRLDPEQVCADGRIALAGLEESNELRVTADFRYTGDGSALHRSVDPADGKIYLYTNLAQAGRVFACFEQADLKAEFTVRVTAPAPWTVMSNQPGAGATQLDGGRAVWNFPATPRISPGAVAVIAGGYQVIRGTHTMPDGRVIPLGLACRASLAGQLDGDDLLDVARTGLDYYLALLGVDFPFGKYDQVFVPQLPAGAIEQPGCVTVSEWFLFRSKVTDVMHENRTRVLLHEMAHSWFGDLVTSLWWDDLWLNEAFAELCAILATAEATRFTGAWTTFGASSKGQAYLEDQQPSAHPVATEAETLTEALGNYDAISYSKGTAVLRQLVAYLGRDEFFAGIRAYLIQHSWGNATLADLLRALENSSGKDLSDWSRAWLRTAGPNTLRPDFDLNEHGEFSTFAVRQEAPAQSPVLRPHRITIGLYQRAGAALTRTYRTETEIAGPRTEVAGLRGLPQPDLILLNDTDLDYAIVRFDDRSLRTLTGSIGDLTDSVARTVCWNAVLDMAQQAELSPPALVRILATWMGREQSISVLQAVLLWQALPVLWQMAGPDWLPAAREILATAATPLLLAAEPGSDWQLAWAQLLASTAVTPGQQDLLTGLLDGTAGIPGLAVDADLRWALLLRLASTGRAGDTRIDAELELDPSGQGRRQALACRAAIPDAAHKAEAWRLLTGSDELGFDDLMAVCPAFNQGDQAGVLAPYAAEYFARMPGIWASRGGAAGALLGKALFPYATASPELLRQIDAFMAGSAPTPGLARIVTECRDMVEKALRARALPELSDAGIMVARAEQLS
jgi:aminopeptidase N